MELLLLFFQKNISKTRPGVKDSNAQIVKRPPHPYGVETK